VENTLNDKPDLSHHIDMYEFGSHFLKKSLFSN